MAPSIFDDYQDVRNTEITSDLVAADDRTLRMAAIPVDGALLDALVRFQETFLSHAEVDRGHEALARAHQDALRASGLKAQVAEAGIALLRAFSGRRWAARKLQTKLEELEARSGPGAEGAEKAEELKDRIREELDKQERATDDLGRRYGAGTVALLRKREPELVALHSRMTRVLSQG